ncbi:MAG: tetratricopeptide repeat protein [Chloroflexota bacterium]|nr:tetratricopeptide repeat protein [Dehalococcoidia bacterium]MDW8254637.1 tetratricopeptide repeat protein [Chloroflexota bacterium]
MLHGTAEPAGIRFCELEPDVAAHWRLPRRVPLLAAEADGVTEASPEAIVRGIRALLLAQPDHPDAAAYLRFAQKTERGLWDAVAEARARGDWRALIRACELLTAIDPDDARALCDLAFAYRRSAPARGRRAEEFFRLAEATYRRAIALAPELPQAQTGLGGLLVERGRPEEAVPFLEHSLKVRADQPSAHLYLGRAYGALGDDRRARDHLQAAIAAAPDDPRPHFYLSVALARLGDRAGAAAALERAMALNPDVVQALLAAHRGE